MNFQDSYNQNIIKRGNIINMIEIAGMILIIGGITIVMIAICEGARRDS